MSADLVILNGTICTVDRLFSYCEAVAVREGTIIDRGTTEEMRVYIGKDTKVIDAQGRLVLPGSNDSHMHACHTGFTMSPSFLDLNGPDYDSLKIIQDKVALAVSKAGPGEWVFGCGFVDSNIKELADEGRMMDRWDLDPVSGNVPVVLTDFSLHSLVCNSAALKLAGMDDSYPQVPHSVGTIGRTPDGKLTGRFNEWGAENLLLKACPILSDQELEDCILRVQRECNRQGITSHNDILGEGGEYLYRGTWGTRPMWIYEKLRQEGKLTARVDINIFSAIMGEASYDAIIRGTDRIRTPKWGDREWVKADAVKFFVDTDGPHWLRKESDRPDGAGGSAWNGSDEEQADEIRRTIIELHRKGWQMGIHSMGGRSMDVCVDAIAEAEQLYPGKDLRHFLIHCDDQTRKCAAKMAKFGILAAIQPTAANIVFGWNTPVLSDREEIFNYQAYAGLGAIQTGGSDSTCFSLNWRQGMQFAVTRTTPAGVSARTDLGMSREDAIRMYTINGAFQEHMEHRRGSIEVNKVADFQILDKNVMTCPADEIGTAGIDMTICGGKVVYEKEN